jgi:hypothetical protein
MIEGSKGENQIGFFRLDADSQFQTQIPGDPLDQIPVHPMEVKAGRAGGNGGGPCGDRRPAGRSSALCGWLNRFLAMVIDEDVEGGRALRSLTVLVVPRRRASSSLRVTVWTPPTRSEGRVLDQVLQVIAMGGADELHPALGDGAGGESLIASVPISSTMMTSGMWFSTASIITACCSIGPGHLHAPGAADPRMRDVAIAGDLVGGVDDDDPPGEVIGQNPRHLPQLGGLAHPRPCPEAGGSAPVSIRSRRSSMLPK